MFFGVFAQSSLGTGAAYVGLLLIAYDRLHSAWGISLVLIADLLPAMFFGPLFGAVADRWSRRRCAVFADSLGALAFAGIALVDSFAATLAFALIAGAGVALFRPASLAALPSLVETRRLPVATSLYAAIADLGLTVGPAIAALLLLAGGPEKLMLINAVTFAVSAVVLASLSFGSAPHRDDELSSSPGRSLLGETREGLRAVARMRLVRTVFAASAAGLFFGGLVNVAELPFITGELGAGNSGYSVIVALAGVGFVVGSLAGSAGGDLPTLKRHYMAGLVLMAVGFLASGLVPVFGLALLTFFAAGCGNGLMLVYERLIVQASVPDELSARAFSVKDALTAWAFALAFLGAGAFLSLMESRSLIVAAGAAGAVAAAMTGWWLLTAGRPGRRFPPRGREGLASISPGPRPVAPALGVASLLTRGAQPVRGHSAREDGANFVDSRERWLHLLEDLG